MDKMDKNMDNKRGKSNRGQLTVFVILALVIVAIIVIFFILRNPSINPAISPSEDPKGYIDDCTKKALVSAETKILNNNGFLNLTTNYLSFNNSRLPYYCFASSALTLCTNKHPALNVEIRKQIYSLVKPLVEKCFNEVREQLQNYNYKEETLNLTIEIVPKQIQVKITKEISYDKNEQRVTLSNFNNALNSPLFDFIVLSNKVTNQEIDCECGEESCNADMLKLSMENRDFEISKPSYERYDEVYLIREILSGKQINFAVRNCYRNAP